jgi:hypothetical protein
MKNKSGKLEDLMSHTDFLAYQAKLEKGGILSPVTLGLLEKHPEKCKICQEEARKK